MPGSPPFVAVKIIVIVSHSIAFITTVLRLIHRKQRYRLWWDDLWAFIALLFDIFVWILFMTVPMGRVNSHMSQSMRMFRKFGPLFTYTTALWASRVSIAVTIVRLLNPGKFRSFAKVVTIIFGLFWLVLVIQKIFRCGINPQGLTWCPVPRVTGYIELGTDILGDGWLVLAPAYMLWIMKISRFHRRLVWGIFACSVLTVGACAAHIYFILVQLVVWTGTTAHIQTGVSITVCNLLVLVTYVYRALFNVEEHAVVSCSTSEDRRDEPSAIGSDNPRVSEREENPVSLTDLGSNFGNTLDSFPSTAPIFEDDRASSHWGSEGLRPRANSMLKTSQPRHAAIVTAATV